MAKMSNLVAVAYTTNRPVYCRDEDINNIIMWVHMMKNHCVNLVEVSIMYDGIILPNPDDDEVFFYASVEAAKSGKVWCEEIHGFVTPSWKSEFESDCFDWADGEYEELVLDAIYRDIYEYTPVTGDYGMAATRDEDVANICSSHGYCVIPCEDLGIDSDGNQIGLWIIRPRDEDEDNDTSESSDNSDRFEDYPETHETAFVGNRLRSYYDHDAGHATFYPIDSHGHSKGRSIEVTLPYSKWADICRRIETTPDEYILQLCKAYNGEEYGVVCHHLDEMPFDRYEDGKGFTHATGWEYLESNGDWVNEYEDDTDDVSHIIVFQF